MPLEYPSFIWGKDIRVENHGDALEVTGTPVTSKKDIETAGDPFRAYMSAIRRFGPHKRQGKNSPHIQFANADTDQKLVQFVKRFGPVVVSSLPKKEQRVDSTGLSPESTSTRFVATQDWAELTSERRAYRCALTLIAELEARKQPNISSIQTCIVEIAETVRRWPGQWLREQKLRVSEGYVLQPCWVFKEANLRILSQYGHTATLDPPQDRLSALFHWPPFDLIELSHHVICELVNAFPPSVYPWGKNPVEAPDWDLRFGIRPVLYYILRRQYLQASGIAVCGNNECRALFEIERGGQVFCSDVCSRHQRQREYWNATGKRLRKRRLKDQNKLRPSVGGIRGKGEEI